MLCNELTQGCVNACLPAVTTGFEMVNHFGLAPLAPSLHRPWGCLLTGVSPKKFTELAKYAVRKKDVIITIMGPVGRCCVVPETVEVALSSKHLWTMTFDVDKVIPRLICWQLNYSAWVKSWFRRATQGGIMDAIQSSTLKRLVLPVPAMDEQLRIDVRYGLLTSRIDSEEQKLQKLRLKKLGLMKALFTDKVII